MHRTDSQGHCLSCGGFGEVRTATAGYITCDACHGVVTYVPRDPGDATPAAINWVGQRVTVRRYGRDYPAVVSRVTRNGVAYADFVYGNGVKRTVRVEP